MYASSVGAFKVDQTRVFTAGFSSGAVMSHLLGCKRAEVIDGVIGVSGIVPSGCTAPMPAFVFHGQSDPTVLFDPNFGSAVTRYASTNGCSGAEQEFSPPNAPVPNAGPRVCVEQSCDPGTPLVYCHDNSKHDFGAWWWVMGYSLNRLLAGN